MKNRALILTVLLLLVIPAVFAADPLDNVQIFPKDHVWNTPITNLPLLPKSAEMVLTENGAAGSVWPTFGYKINFVNKSTAKYYRATAAYTSTPDILYPVPNYVLAISNGNGDGTCNTAQYDCHTIVVDTDTWHEYDYFGYSGTILADNTLKIKSAGNFKLTDYDTMGSSHGTSMAIHSPMLLGIVRYSEIEAGVIPHALQIAVPYTRYGNYIWPADRSNSIYTSFTGDKYIRMGERIRLNASYDTSKMSRTARIVAQAMKDYGMIVVDNGELTAQRTWEIRGLTDPHWNAAEIAELRAIKSTDLEVIDESSLMWSKTSGQVRPGTVPTPTPTPTPVPTPTPQVTQSPTTSLTVTAPAGGETWIRGSTIQIKWSAVGDTGSTTKVDIYKGGKFLWTNWAAHPNTGLSVPWTVPAGMVTGSDFQIKVSNIANPMVNDTSGFFSIGDTVATPTPTLTPTPTPTPTATPTATATPVITTAEPTATPTPSPSIVTIEFSQRMMDWIEGLLKRFLGQV